MTDHFYKQATDALQFLDELGGPDARQYIDIMQRLSAECALRAQTAFNSHCSARAVYEEMGFHLDQTGGGCTAYTRRNAADGTLITITTQADEVLAPTDAAQPVLVGLYADDNEHGPRCLAYFYAPDSDAVKWNLSNGRWIQADK